MVFLWSVGVPGKRTVKAPSLGEKAFHSAWIGDCATAKGSTSRDSESIFMEVTLGGRAGGVSPRSKPSRIKTHTLVYAIPPGADAPGSRAGGSAAQDFQQPLEVVVRLEAQHDLPLVLAAQPDLHLDRELLPQL